MNLKKSINVKYDLNDSSLLGNYYATQSHLDIIGNVLRGIRNQGARSHIAYGPYGAGKSYISTILANILLKSYNKKLLSELSEKYSLIDDEVSKQISNSVENPIKYINVTLNGYEIDFQEAIYISIKNALAKENIVINPKGTAKSIKLIVEKWERDFPEVIDKFYVFLKINKFENIENFFDVLNYDDEVLQRFTEFYESVSAGAKLSLYRANEFDETILEISKQLEKKKLGLFIIYDEFGRFLQSIEESRISKFFGELQNLAELINQSKNLTLLLVSHKPINYYFKNLSTELRLEFSKIEKRFTNSEIKSDASTFVNIALQVTERIAKPVTDDQILTDLFEGVYKFNLFSQSIIPNGNHELLIKRSYPLHPVTTILLPKFSQLFGQNERTLFTFLYDESKFGFRGYASTHNDAYYPDLLVDFFFSGSEEKYNDNFKEVVIYKKLYNQLNSFYSDDYLELAQRILKFILLWNITNSNSIFVISKGLISFSLGIDSQDVEIIVDSLIYRKIIRQNLIHKNYEIIEASAADIENEISKALLLIKQKPGTLDNVLNNYNPHNTIYSKLYNYEHDTVRFCSVYIFLESIQNKLTSQSDYQLFFIFNNSIKQSVPKNTFIGILNYDKEMFTEKVQRLASIDSLLGDRHFLSEFKNVDIDLQYEKDKILIELEVFYAELFSRNTKFTFDNHVYRIGDKSDFERVINDLISKNFCEPLVIHNDQINMFVIQKPQIYAIQNIIKRMILEQTNVLYYEDNDNSAEAFAYYAISNSNIEKLSNHIRKYIRKNENGKVSEILKSIEDVPFGVRPTLTSVVFVYSVIDMWKNIMFFNNGEYISNIPASYIYDIGVGKYDCVYNYSDFDFRNRDFLLSIIKIFGNYSEGTGSKSLGIQALSSLYSWFLDLPILTQLGYINNEEEKKFIRILEMSKQNPRKALLDLSNMYDIQKLKLLKVEIESIFMSFIKKLENEIMLDLKIENWKLWASGLSDALQRNNKLVGIALNSDQFVLDYAKEIEQLEISKWPKSMFDVLKSRIQTDYVTINNKLDVIDITINNKKTSIVQVELSTRAKNLLNNLNSQLEANAKYITKEEIEMITVKLLKNVIKQEE